MCSAPYKQPAPNNLAIRASNCQNVEKNLSTSGQKKSALSNRAHLS